MAKIKNLPANKIEIFNLFARAVRTKSDIIGQNWKFRTKLDNPDKIGQFGHNLNIRTRMDNSDDSDKIGQT